MVTKLEIVRQYTNVELCQKWNNNIPLDELQSPDYDYIENSQDLESIQETFTGIDLSDITAAIVRYGDGDYSEIYVTESSHPYALTAIYHPLEYYL